MRQLLETLLTDRGHSVECVESAEAALQRFDDAPFDLLVVDWILPGMSGLDLTRTIRARQAGDTPFILMLTGRNEPDDLTAMLDAGASDFVAKPPSARLLETRLAFAERSIRAEASRRRMQEHLLLTDRLASVGTLAAGMAHELNNPLTFVLSNLKLLAEELGEGADDAVREQLDDATDGAERIARIVGDLRAFSSGVNDPVDVVAPRDAVTAALRLCWNELRHRIRIEQTLDDVPDVRAPRGVVAQVVLKLLLHAMASLGEDTSGRRLLVQTQTTPDGRARISVGHDGPPIAPEAMATLFDPFSESESGEPARLGLAISSTLVARVGGTLIAESTDEVTFFHATFPSGQTAVSSTPPTGTTRDAGRARVVIIDDERALGRSLARVLRKHEVSVFESAKVALEHIDHADLRPQLILCDLMMPEMNGMQFFEALRERHPELVDSVTFMTGGAFTPKAADFVRESGRPVLAKPFDLMEIRRLARAAGGAGEP